MTPTQAERHLIAFERHLEGEQPTANRANWMMPPAAEQVRCRCLVVDGEHELAVIECRFPDGTVAPYVRIRESHREPAIERWFALPTLVHLAVNVGEDEVWQIGNRELGHGS